MTRTSERPKIYLGNGVYGSYDGTHVVIYFDAQDVRIEMRLTPDMLACLDTYRGYLERLDDEDEEPK